MTDTGSLSLISCLGWFLLLAGLAFSLLFREIISLEELYLAHIWVCRDEVNFFAPAGDRERWELPLTGRWDLLCL